MSDITANVVIANPSQQFTRSDVFQALFHGKIYIGQIDKDPTDPANQIDVFVQQEDGSLLKVAQPIRTNAAGFPVYNGKIVKYVTDKGHSMALYDASDVLVNYYDNVLKYDPDQFSGTVSNPDGLKVIGRCVSVAQLRTITGKKDQWINVASYNEGTHIGGGFFYWVDDISRVDDSGVFFRVNANGGWVRDLPDVSQLNVNHFGAVPNGKVDCAPAIQLMHNWSVAYAQANGQSVQDAPGVQLSYGNYAVSSIDLGTAEIPAFKMTGPVCFYGVIPRCTITPLSLTTTTPFIAVNPRRLEISHIKWNAKGSTQPFCLNRCPRGSYVRVHCFVSTNNGGIVFQVADSIDTQFDQIYAYNGTASFLKGTWTNGQPGEWDHLTAIEFSNCNFTSMKGSDPVINTIRATQCIMRNVWFTNPGCAMDISQGGWLMDTLIIEGAERPIKAQYSKLQLIGCRVEQGAGWDYDASGYDPAMDDPSVGGKGRIPNWVTNGYDQGRFELNNAGFSMKDGAGFGFIYSNTIMENVSGQPQWMYVGRITVTRLGDAVKMRFLGAANWDSANGTLDRPGGTAFGSGETVLCIEGKSPSVETTSLREAHWYNEGNGPIDAIKLVHTWNYHYIYVRMRQYAREVGVFIETTGLPRLRAGTPFYFVPSNTTMTQAEVDALANAYDAPARWAINRADFAGNGLGMDLDTGDFLMFQKNRLARYGIDYAPITYNGQSRWLQINDQSVGAKTPFLSKAELAQLSPATMVARTVLVSDARGTPYGRGTSRFAWSDGYQWTWADDLSVVSFT